jgi:UDP-2-acetamido-3-amino-2,3-dideoxy-glucuronate N-acetyltransferase
MIHSQALVDDLSSLGSGTNVWAFAHVMKGASVGSRCNIGDHAFLESGAIVGNNVTIKNRVLIWEGVTIEDDVFVGPGVVFTNDRFPRSPRMPEAKSRYSDRANWLVLTRVERGCSIGAAAIICPGVVLGRYAMVAAGSVVTKSIEPHSLVVGSPAKHIGYVCTCGQKLNGHYQEAVCDTCGECGSVRSARQPG